jgi:hypothetical protein
MWTESTKQHAHLMMMSAEMEEERCLLFVLGNGYGAAKRPETGFRRERSLAARHQEVTGLSLF